jgi:hypothetical protein
VAFPSHGKNDMVHPHDPRFEIAPCLAYHLVRSKFGRLKPDDLPPTLDNAFGCGKKLEFVPGLTSNRGQYAFARLDGQGASLDNGYFGWRRGRRNGTFVKHAPRLIGQRRSTFPLIQAGRAFGGRPSASGVARSTQHRCQCQTGVAVIDQPVGAFGQSDGSLRDPPSLIVIAAAREQLRPKCAPGNRSLQRVACKSLTFRAQFVGLGISIERQTCATEQRSGLGGIGVETHATKTVAGLAKMRLGRSRIAQNQLYNARELLDLQKRMAQTEFGDRAPS